MCLILLLQTEELSLDIDSSDRQVMNSFMFPEGNLRPECFSVSVNNNNNNKP